MNRIQNALVYAAWLHEGQRRKLSGEPYLAHLLAVASLVMEDGGSEDETIAALLHDAVEDQGGQSAREEILRRFGAKVLDIVDGCSDSVGRPKRPWRERKELHIERLAVASSSVRRIVAADKLHNARSIIREYAEHGESLWENFHGGRDGKLWYFRAGLDVLARAGRTPTVDELTGVVEQMESLGE
jgi:(p)ppGpp synthase/HD superfamily hydrolase